MNNIEINITGNKIIKYIVNWANAEEENRIIKEAVKGENQRKKKLKKCIYKEQKTKLKNQNKH